MIPKIVHYCWFGGNPLPESAIKCINSWKKFFPDYEIKEWNEQNFDVNSIPYTAEAYRAKKYAFVSDYARFWILYKYGGLYFDTDVEVIRPMDDIIERGPFMGMEVDGDVRKQIFPVINPGLCMGAAAKMPLYRRMLDGFAGLSFCLPDGTRNNYTMIPMISDILKADGLQPENGIQKVDGCCFYPKEYFNPLDSLTGVLKKTPNTRSIHWYMASWAPPQPWWKKKAKQFIRRILRYVKL